MRWVLTCESVYLREWPHEVIYMMYVIEQLSIYLALHSYVRIFHEHYIQLPRYLISNKTTLTLFLQKTYFFSAIHTSQAKRNTLYFETVPNQASIEEERICSYVIGIRCCDRQSTRLVKRPSLIPFPLLDHFPASTRRPIPSPVRCTLIHSTPETNSFPSSTPSIRPRFIQQAHTPNPFPNPGNVPRSALAHTRSHIRIFLNNSTNAFPQTLASLIAEFVTEDVVS